MVKSKRYRGGKGSLRRKGGRRSKRRGGRKVRRTYRRGGQRRVLRRGGQRRTRRRRGGYGPGAGPVGYAWNGGDVGSWPGVYASQGGDTNGAVWSNHYALSPGGVPAGPFDPPISSTNPPSRLGKLIQAGGAPLGYSEFVPQGLLNAYRVPTTALGNVYNSYVGQHADNSPLPWNQPIDTSTNLVVNSPPDVLSIQKQADQAVTNI